MYFRSGKCPMLEIMSIIGWCSSRALINPFYFGTLPGVRFPADGLIVHHDFGATTWCTPQGPLALSHIRLLPFLSRFSYLGNSYWFDMLVVCTLNFYPIFIIMRYEENSYRPHSCIPMQKKRTSPVNHHRILYYGWLFASAGGRKSLSWIWHQRLGKNSLGVECPAGGAKGPLLLGWFAPLAIWT